MATGTPFARLTQLTVAQPPRPSLSRESPPARALLQEPAAPGNSPSGSSAPRGDLGNARGGRARTWPPSTLPVGRGSADPGSCPGWQGPVAGLCCAYPCGTSRWGPALSGFQPGVLSVPLPGLACSSRPCLLFQTLLAPSCSWPEAVAYQVQRLNCGCPSYTAFTPHGGELNGRIHQWSVMVMKYRKNMVCVRLVLLVSH